ncbi:hypothetical protein Tco_1539030 [Tanacetum coccineum]
MKNEKNEDTVNVVCSTDDEPVLSSLGGLIGEKVTGTNKGTQKENVGQCLTSIKSTALNEGNVSINVIDLPTIDPIKSGLCLSGSTSYAKLVTSEPSKKSVNFCTLIAPKGNEADVAILVEFVRTISEHFANNVHGFFRKRVLDECPKNIVSDVVKNLKTSRQAVRGVEVGLKVVFKPTKQVYRLVSNKNNASTIGKKNKLRCLEKSSKLVGKGANSGVSPFDHRFFHVASSSTITTHIVERIDKLGRRIIDGKLTLVDDDGKPLPKVVFMVNKDSDSEVEDVVNQWREKKSQTTTPTTKKVPKPMAKMKNGQHCMEHIQHDIPVTIDGVHICVRIREILGECDEVFPIEKSLVTYDSDYGTQDDATTKHEPEQDNDGEDDDNGEDDFLMTNLMVSYSLPIMNFQMKVDGSKMML